MAMQKYNCQACHQIYGLGGLMGPDLTNVIEKGAPYVKAMLQFGSDRMPVLSLTTQEMDDVAEYLAFVGETGHSPLRNFELTRFGTVNVIRDSM